MDSETIKNQILVTLEAIQKAPKMYGSPQTQEVLVFVLLSLLVDSEKVRIEFENEVERQLGYRSCQTLSSQIGEQELIKSLKRIQDQVLGFKLTNL
jgi:hypothetical protein